MGYDILLKETDPELVWLEMDVYWITQAGRGSGAAVEPAG